MVNIAAVLPLLVQALAAVGMIVFGLVVFFRGRGQVRKKYGKR